MVILVPWHLYRPLGGAYRYKPRASVTVMVCAQLLCVCILHLCHGVCVCVCVCVYPMFTEFVCYVHVLCNLGGTVNLDDPYHT